ncbi:MAG: BlaI/MecI/CopY family transcriptional regulator [Paenibacillus macerans]|uniref:BlaI/MecI/CopY family transcriptional regulator n=1 Tax=Paenibacillus macerans TaxID=44252 RepID=A0A090YSA4_PAEMA|nr:BlaI/MecI/CopY family transcriptional regulator [Paenibacillus macerans]KFN00853.1 penicillinase repressor family protein [Paenibacillus macerans]MBS5911908.1 BlaI/MecI/CopY family transcriptional regulator [Paenibacillus macerans]MCY7561927.1 BlaI/MecI/CopY family transcriptional regulator [Paenibacillus macerans]MDU7474260.1 BlaI/MecI/CopY family transcriptional regulator [Paenibacillus macerans]MEC0153663.1 BlaI/MecI/CopY family transcriptional regulator [Paenibacillus macerans]
MSRFKKLPDTEFEIMKVAWANEPPITTAMVMEQLGNKREWKAPTVISLMMRLVEKGFLRTEKKGKERTYFPLVTKEDYLKFETGKFMQLYHENSFLSFVNALYDGKRLSDRDIEELVNWVRERGK